MSNNKNTLKGGGSMKITGKIFKSTIEKLAKHLIVFKLVKTEGERKKFQDLWGKIWLEEKYAVSQDALLQLFKKYDKFNKISSDFLIKIRCVGIFLGTFRIIWPVVEMPSPLYCDFDLEPSCVSRLPEVTLLTILPRYRKLRINLFVFREIYRQVAKKGYQGIVMAADIRLFRLLKTVFPIKKIGDSKFYEGSETVPSLIDFEETRKFFEKKNPALLQFFEK